MGIVMTASCASTRPGTAGEPATGPRRPWQWLMTAVALTALGGCASFTEDAGFGAVASATRERLGMDLRWARQDGDRAAIEARVAELLARPLAVDDAVQLALLNNKDLQASFFDLGIGMADLVQAGRLPNPGFSVGRSTRGHEVESERGLHFNLARVLTMPLLMRVEERRFAQTQGMVSASVFTLAADTRKAYFNALAAEETVRYMRQVQQAADASAELARRMAAVGNFNRLQQMREQGFYADATQNLARAQQAQRATRDARAADPAARAVGRPDLVHAAAAFARPAGAGA